MMRVALALAAFLFAALPAQAGDYADRTLIGFSEDGAYFAFEEYGIQDGSGFPYSNVFIIDVDKDAWIDGTPIRVRVDDEGAMLSTTRYDAMTQARPVLDRLNIIAKGSHVVDNPATELSADPYAVRFRTNQWFNMAERPWSLKLTRIPMPGSKGCEDFDDVAGFKLELTDPDGTTRVLSEDISLPASRTCARDYAISDVVVLPPEKGVPRASMAVMISLIRQGFEGPDRRFLAVTTRFEDN
jgi:predicted secreted protein